MYQRLCCRLSRAQCLARRRRSRLRIFAALSPLVWLAQRLPRRCRPIAARSPFRRRGRSFRPIDRRRRTAAPAYSRLCCCGRRCPSSGPSRRCARFRQCRRVRGAESSCRSRSAHIVRPDRRRRVLGRPGRRWRRLCRDLLPLDARRPLSLRRTSRQMECTRPARRPRSVDVGARCQSDIIVADPGRRPRGASVVMPMYTSRLSSCTPRPRAGVLIASRR